MTNPDTLIDANHATEGAAWLLRHRTHVLAHNERGFRCMDCEGTHDAVWLTAAAWNEVSATLADAAELRALWNAVRQPALGLANDLLRSIDARPESFDLIARYFTPWVRQDGDHHGERRSRKPCRVA